ncbi:hypothetical protein B0O99DRAFT_638144 [Bisporella sp. PMI_857]|nr:hypothetical protein B0O99DRAFT_638144 [Bisporella sp. PMI_857]
MAITTQGVPILGNLPQNSNPALLVTIQSFGGDYNEPLSKFPNLQNFTAFGSGSRICPRMNIARRSLYILAARIAWVWKISKKQDSAGREIPVWLFELVIRNKERKGAIVKAWGEAMSGNPLSS